MQMRYRTAPTPVPNGELQVFHPKDAMSMIRSLTIDGYRGFKHLEIEGLGRVNLLVGKNNCGKSSVLEALYLLHAAGNPLTFWHILSQRSEIQNEMLTDRKTTEFEVRHLFHGHELANGTSFTLSASDAAANRFLACTVAEMKTETNAPSNAYAQALEQILPLQAPLLALELNGAPQPVVPYFPLTPSSNLLGAGKINLYSLYHELGGQYITGTSLLPDELLAMWNAVVLKGEDDEVVRLLQCLEPSLERIIHLGMRSGFVVKLKETPKPIPIGTLGDGMWRMLALATASVYAKDSILLVDEIDTGLHYTVLGAMWKLLIEISKRLNIQIVATTHSLDCVTSLATICRDGIEADSEVVLYRIERNGDGQGRAVSYTEDEILKLACYGIEAR